MLNKMLILVAILIAFSGISFASDIWGRQMSSGNFWFSWNSTASGYQTYNVKVPWADVLNPPAALGGGSTLPIINITNLAGSDACSGTDKVTNITVSNSGVAIVCGSDDTGNGTGSGVTVPWTNVTGYPGATIPLTNTTGSTSKTCTGSDKLYNVSITNGVLLATCQGDTDTNSGGTITSIATGWGLNATTITTSGTISVNKTQLDILYDLMGDSVPWSNVTSYPGVSALAWANVTYPGATIPWSNITSYPGVTGLAWANVTYPGVTVPWANITYPGSTIPLGNITGSTSGQCSSTDKATNITITNGILSLTCSADATAEGGSGYVPWINITNYPGVTALQWANITYPGATLPYANVTGVGLTAIPWANITYPGVTGLTIGTNITGFGVSIPQGNITTGVTVPWTNTSYPGANNIPQSNLTGIRIPFANTTGGVGSIPYGNITGVGLTAIPWTNITYPGATIPLANTTGTTSTICTAGQAVTNITITNGEISATTCKSVAGLGSTTTWANVTSYPGVTSLAWANVTYPGATLPAGNITNATSFPTSNFTMPGNLTVSAITIACSSTSCNMSRSSTSQWIVWNSTGIYISGG